MGVRWHSSEKEKTGEAERTHHDSFLPCIPQDRVAVSDSESVKRKKIAYHDSGISCEQGCHVGGCKLELVVIQLNNFNLTLCNAVQTVHDLAGWVGVALPL